MSALDTAASSGLACRCLSRLWLHRYLVLVANLVRRLPVATSIYWYRNLIPVNVHVHEFTYCQTPQIELWQCLVPASLFQLFPPHSCWYKPQGSLLCTRDHSCIGGTAYEHQFAVHVRSWHMGWHFPVHLSSTVHENACTWSACAVW